MTMSYKLADSVSEMMHMREEGMPNKAIAHRFGCNASSVYRMIGKQPVGIRMKRASKPCPPVVDKVPEMPRQSFRQRCEEALGMPEKVEVVETVVKTRNDLHKVLDDMALLFGKTAVKAYLRCAGYLAGTQDGSPVLSSEDCFAELRQMEGE